MWAKFICIDGLDGLGKSTQISLLPPWLESLKLSSILCFDPGGTAFGGTLREILLKSKEHLAPRAEALLFMASRAQLVNEIIEPALQAGKIVLCDRFTTSNIVYQGYASGLPLEELRAAVHFSAGGLQPDLTIILDAPVEVGWSRRGKDPDRMESRGKDYWQKVRDGFLREAERERDRFAIIDANRSLEEVQSQIRQTLLEKFQDWGLPIS
ncbi:MAG: dTMP kinase [Gemmataceae bacterium]|jgi:dTMP kinase|nr:dTMP kinase [Gemmataceae bacterium]